MQPHAFVLIAHRGESSIAPENTMDAFKAALDHGIPHMEMDVQLTQDGVCCVLHDEVLGRTVPGEGPVAEHAWSELSTRDAGSWFAARSLSADRTDAPPSSAPSSAPSQDWSHCRVPAFRDVLDTCRGRAHLHVVRGCGPRVIPTHPS